MVDLIVDSKKGDLTGQGGRGHIFRERERE